MNTNADRQDLYATPLDDRQLLAEGSQQDRWVATAADGRGTAPTQPLAAWPDRGWEEAVQADFHGRSVRLEASSPALPISSPTVALLQNRTHNKTTTSNRPFVKPSIANSTSNLLGYESADGEDQNYYNTLNRRTLRRDGPPSFPNSPPVIQGIQLIQTKELPDRLRGVFSFGFFNAIQSRCFAATFRTDDNVVVAAPTGSGKTVIMELAICRLMLQNATGDFKVVYQAPTKTLCSERYRDWQAKFGVLGLQCAELTGDTERGDLHNVQRASIIITTPEKWDSVTRKWKDQAKLMRLVRLFLVDEVHILKEPRGATLEAVASRMKSMNPHIRFIALSATVPNSEDIATWLGKNSASPYLPAHREVFGEGFRPVQLRKHVYGFRSNGNDFAFESMLTKHIPDIISNHGRGKPVMVFCSTRKASVSTAKVLAELWQSVLPSQRLWEGPSKPITIADQELKDSVAAGVAFHHAGLSLADRREVESAFLHGQINVICSTSTLAVGVNLPCYLVILKGTMSWTNGGLQEYADLEVMQMLGRAGRPQFENSACAVILTQNEKVPRYEKMVSGEEELESCLHLNLIEHLNAEIGLGTIYDLASAKQWLSSTFMYVRLSRNSAHYHVREGLEACSDDELLEKLCEKDIGLLEEAGLIEQVGRLKVTEFGDVMARYCISFDTMKQFIALPPKAKLSELLSVLASASEFKEVRMLAGEKSFFREINKAPEIKFPIKVDVALRSHKISLIIQAELGNVTLPSGENHKKHLQQYRLDKTQIFNQANRLIRSIIDCMLHREDATASRHALDLGRSLAAHVWDNTASQLRQIDGLGEVGVRKLAAASISSIETLINTEPQRLELVLGKNPPFGRELLKKLDYFPKLRVSVRETSRELKVGSGIMLKFQAEIGFLQKPVPLFFKKKPIYVCFLAEDSWGKLIDFRRFHAKRIQHGEVIYLSSHLIKPTSSICCFVMCDEIAGTSKFAELDIRNIPEAAFPSRKQSDLEKPTSRYPGQKPAGFPTDEFDDEGIDDKDLLGVEEINGEKIEIVQDIDDVLNNTPINIFSEPLTRQSAGEENCEDESQDILHKPVQLPNGRWSCQHDCNDRDKNCRHKCCREGVAKPRRRATAETKSKLDEQHPVELTSKRSSKLPANNKASVAGPQATFTSGIEHPKEMKLTAKRKRSRESQFNARRQTQIDKKRLSTDHAVLVAPSYVETSGEVGSNHISSPRAKNDKQAVLEDLDLSEADLDFVDCDWILSEAYKPEDDKTFSQGKDGSTGQHKAPPLPADHLDDFFDYDVDNGGIEPPFDHVAMADVQQRGKSLFLPSNSSSPERTSLSVLTATQTSREIFGRCALFDGERNDVVQPRRNCSEDWDIGQNLHLNRHNNVGATRTLGSSSQDCMRNSSANYQSAEGSCKPHDAMPPTSQSPWLHISAPSVTHNSTQQSDEERKRLHEEDQRKKWEGLDTWLYDEFHDFVEIV